MDESEIQQKRRDNEEQATADRARILGLPYLDTREFENSIELVSGLLDVSEMHQSFIIPLQKKLLFRWDGFYVYHILKALQFPENGKILILGSCRGIIALRGDLL